MGIIVGLIAFSTALGPMLAFRKHCTRSHTSALNMQDGWGPGQKSNAIDATSDRIHSTQARLHLHGLRGPPQGDVRRGAPRAPRTGEPRRGVRRAAARVDQYGLTFSRRTTTQGSLSTRSDFFRPSGKTLGSSLGQKLSRGVGPGHTALGRLRRGFAPAAV